MNIQIEESWKAALKEIFEKPYFAQLTQEVRREYASVPCAPQGSNIFRAFNLCPFDKVKVVILGQDPYHTPGVADGLAFSTPPHNPIPPSLRNIYKEMAMDLQVETPSNGDLTHWAKEGVFLLNTQLTVRIGQANSHLRLGWPLFTDDVISCLSSKKEHLVFILWGSNAARKKNLIDTGKHLVLSSVHPSPLSASRGFFGSKPFSQTNYFLLTHNLQPIRWVEQQK